MGLWTLLEGCLLIANALAILNEDRFLAPRVLKSSSYDPQLPLHCCKTCFWLILEMEWQFGSWIFILTRDRIMRGYEDM
ncbi:hypothetical protein L2E82_27730 [Cichorium intybus]|uniref:Uncharacterized protein n=1 Tax=Cichorium intybus TaxID=13427 RepID=A0ACB9CTU8_CICIN|nr:hypothetical protein L2E82_27730 [Cichorium intybus]